VKKICFVVATPFTANAFLLSHLKALAKEYQVTLCLNATLYQIFPDFEQQGIRIINIPIERKLSIWSDLRTLKKLIIIFREEQFDCVHTLTPKAGLIGIISANLSAVTHRLHTFTGQIWINDLGFNRWFYQSIDHVIAKLATHVFCDSASQAKFLQDEKIVTNKSIKVIGGASIAGVDLDRFNPQAGQNLGEQFPGLCEPNHFHFLFVGRITRDKGIVDLIEAYRALYLKNPQARLWIVGPDEEDLKAKIEIQWPDLKGVTWVGPTNTPEIFMAEADILVLPSYREGFGSVIIEAAACKTTTVAYQIIGVVDAIDDGQTGLLVKKGDIKALEFAMNTLMLNPDLLNQMGEKAYERATTFFSGRKITNSWLREYESILKV